MNFIELDGNQRKQLINVQQLYQAWLRADNRRATAGTRR